MRYFENKKLQGNPPNAIEEALRNYSSGTVLGGELSHRARGILTLL
jgi:hypothetical protein